MAAEAIPLVKALLDLTAATTAGKATKDGLDKMNTTDNKSTGLDTSGLASGPLAGYKPGAGYAKLFRKLRDNIKDKKYRDEVMLDLADAGLSTPEINKLINAEELSDEQIHALPKSIQDKYFPMPAETKPSVEMITPEDVSNNFKGTAEYKNMMFDLMPDGDDDDDDKFNKEKKKKSVEDKLEKAAKRMAETKNQKDIDEGIKELQELVKDVSNRNELQPNNIKELISNSAKFNKNFQKIRPLLHNTEKTKDLFNQLLNGNYTADEINKIYQIADKMAIAARDLGL